VADLGVLRVFRRVRGRNDSRAHLEPVSEWESEPVRDRLSEQVSDRAGSFPEAGSKHTVLGDMAVGERHNIELEHRCRAIQTWAAELQKLLGEKVVLWLAAAPRIHQQLLDEFAPAVRAKIVQVLSLDLTRVRPEKLLSHFGE